MVDNLLELREITKLFPGVIALDKVTLTIRRGEIHALVGENGAGKTTLVKVISGAYLPDRGTMLWQGKPTVIHSPIQSQALGIFAIHQHRNLVPFFSGYENLFLGRPYPQKVRGVLDWRKLREKGEQAKRELGIEVDLALPAQELTPAQMTLIEIMRALLVRAQLIILDEPTASLSENEVQALFTLIRVLREKDTSFLYVSHRLEEIFLLADRVTVLRNGRLVETRETTQTSKTELIALMAGEKAGHDFPPPPPLGDAPVILSVHDLATMDGKVKGVNFDLRRGEILGLFGLVGAGRTELLEALYGIRPVKKGSVILEGKPVTLRNSLQAIETGLALVPEDRVRSGVIPSLSVRANIALPILERFRMVPWFPVPHRGREKQVVWDMVGRLRIKTAGPEQRVASLSGGNQQKLVLAKWMARGAKVFLCDEPTHGVDVHARREIYELLYQLVRQGAAMILVSSDLSEILTVSHRIGVMVGGRLVKIFEHREVLAQEVLSLCYGEESGCVAGSMENS